MAITLAVIRLNETRNPKLIAAVLHNLLGINGIVEAGPYRKDTASHLLNRFYPKILRSPTRSNIGVRVEDY